MNIDFKEAYDFEKNVYSYLAGFGAFLITNKFLRGIDSNKISRHYFSIKRAAVRLGKLALSYGMAKLAKESMEDIFDRAFLYANAVIEAEVERRNADDHGMMA